MCNPYPGPILYPTKDFSRLATESVDAWDAVCPKQVHYSVSKDKSPLYCLAWINFGRSLLTGSYSGDLAQINGSTFAQENVFEAHKAAVYSAAVSHSDNIIATGDANGEVKFWNRSLMPLLGDNAQRPQIHTETVRGISFAPGDTKIVTCSDDKTAKVVDVETGKQEVVFDKHSAEVKTCEWHPQKALVMSGGKDNLCKLWDPKSGEMLCTLYSHHQQINRIRWHANGNWVMTASKDASVKVHDIRTMKTINNFQQHKKEVTAIAWHPTIEELLVSGSADALIYWNMKEGGSEKEILLAHEKEITGIAWHPLGHMLATSSLDNTTKVCFCQVTTLW